MHLRSIFHEISKTVFKMTRLDEAKTFISEFVNGKNIKETDKNQILRNVSECKNMTRLQTYICNSLLQFEGLKVA